MKKLEVIAWQVPKDIDDMALHDADKVLDLFTWELWDFCSSHNLLNLI